MKISIIIPTFKRPALLPALVDSYLAQRVDAEIELIIVDDGSDDDTPAVLARLCHLEPRLKVESQPNSGQAAARNRGIDLATGDILLFSDDDMVPSHEDFLNRHLEKQQEHPGAYVSRLTVPGTLATTPFQKYWRRRLQGGTVRFRTGQDLGRGGFWFATLSIPASLLGSDRFERAFRRYGWEEHELGYRLHRRGLRARFLRDAVAEHRDEVRFSTVLDKFRCMGEMAWVFYHLHPRLEVALWTGVHPLSRLARRLVMLETRVKRFPQHDGADLRDREYALCLEAAYARGLRQGG